LGASASTILTRRMRPMLNLIGSHDTERLLTLCGDDLKE
jgi:hypothetical protein